MILVILESPWRGGIAICRQYLNDAIRDCLTRGESPYASHMMLTGALNDANAQERDFGIKAGFEWRRVATKTVVYIDLGISEGMRLGLEHAAKIGHPVERRALGGSWGAIWERYVNEMAKAPQKPVSAR